jgi:alkylation response protein AidB-like acyl-CoA dehydrogenase
MQPTTTESSPTSSIATEANPGLAPFDLTEYEGVAGYNFYKEDPLLRRFVAVYARSGGKGDETRLRATENHLMEFGELTGGILNELTIAAHKEGKYGEVVPFDATGNRIDEVRYCHEQNEARRICYEHGIVNLNYHADWPHEFTMLHRMALAYLANLNGEGGVNCPLAMTDGMIRVLEALGTPDQKKRYLPLVAGPDSDSHFMAGQYVTERVGGSNVGQNRTVARRGEAENTWILNGEKWFCSNPGDLWVTTARVLGPDGEATNTIGMFLVPRIKRNGELNGCRILRKKDIIGSRGKITVETVYEDLEAEELGRPAHGLANMIKYVIGTSRIHVAVAACGTSRRAYLEARAYVQSREAYGKKVIEFPTVLRTLAEMQILHSSILWCNFRNFLWSDQNHAASQLITPLMKYISTTHATWITHEAMMLHGGNGILGDFSVLPRLHNDAIINETWEGTHNIIGEHVLKAFSRPRVRAAFFDLLEENLSAYEAAGVELPYVKKIFQQERRVLEDCEDYGSEWAAMNRLAICDSLYHCLALSEWMREARDKEELIIGFARGLAEIVERGRLGPTRPHGVFSDRGLMQALVAY